MRACIYGAVSAESPEMRRIRPSFRENGTMRDQRDSEARENDRAGFVYFIRAGRMRAVKIGWATDPDARLAALQTASHHRLHMIGHLPGSHADEQEWHGRFRSIRIRGEWFNLTDELRQAINTALFGTEGAVRYSLLSLDWVRAGALARRA